MFFALDYDNKRCSAENAEKGKVYCCEGCGEKLILKKGTSRRAHFAHASESNCQIVEDLNNLMSDWHIQWQEQFPEENREIVVREINKYQRADIVIGDRFYSETRPNQYNYIVEFQHSPMSPIEFIDRTNFYLEHCNALIWVFDLENDYNNGDVYEYEKNKWRWNRPVNALKLFSNRINKFKGRDGKVRRMTWYHDKVYLLFQFSENNIKQVVWSIETKEFEKIGDRFKPIYSYKRFYTKSDTWTKKELVEAIKNDCFTTHQNIIKKENNFYIIE